MDIQYRKSLNSVRLTAASLLVGKGIDEDEDAAAHNLGTLTNIDLMVVYAFTRLTRSHEDEENAEKEWISSNQERYNFIPDTELGLTQTEILMLRGTQEVVAQSRSTTLAHLGQGTRKLSSPTLGAESATSSHTIQQRRFVRDPVNRDRFVNVLNSLGFRIKARIDYVSRLTLYQAQ